MPNTAKSEAIRKAYGEYWEQVKDELHQGMYICLIDERSSTISWNGIVMTIHDFDNHLYMPQSLQGIDDNNGWIRIESEDDLPKDSFNYYAFCSNGSVMTFNDFEYYKKYIIPELKATHYQPIVKPEKPIY